MKHLAAALGLGLGLLSISAPAKAADVEAACTRTIVAYANAWDHNDAGGFANLFTDDAVLNIGGGDAKGRAAITELFAKRNPMATTRHMITNVQITAGSAGSATGRSYALLFTGPPPASATLPISADGYTIMGEYNDRFQISFQGCRIVERRLTTVFRKPRPPQP